MADKRSLVTSRLLTQKILKNKKLLMLSLSRSLIGSWSELEVKDFLSIRSCKLRKKKFQRNISKCG